MLGATSSFEAGTDNAVMSIAMLNREMDDVAEFVENGLAPRGILPFHVLYDDQPLIRSALVLLEGTPSSGKVIAFDAKDLPSHRSPSNLAHHRVIASSFGEWLRAWFDSGFARTQGGLEEATESPPTEPIVRGDIITVDGEGYHWVTEVFEQHGVKKLRYETFAMPDKRARPPQGYPRAADLAYCRKVSERLRAEVLPLIPKEILSILPSDRPRAAQL